MKNTSANKVRALLAKGRSAIDIANQVGVTRQYVYNIRSKMRKGTDVEAEAEAKPVVSDMEGRLSRALWDLNNAEQQIQALKTDRDHWYDNYQKYLKTTVWQRIVYVFRGYL